MADDVAKWGSLDLEVPPPFMEPIITAINDFLEMIVAFLDILLVVLEICKVFVLGLLSPILAVIEAIIALLEALANDLRKAGFYFRYDEGWFNNKNFQENITAHMGGFSAFESRCFNWLIDSSDPNRPDFSTASGVLGLFFYMSVDVSEVIKLIKVIMSLIRFFKNMPGKGTMLQTPTDLEFTLKKDFFTPMAWASAMDDPEDPPEMGELTWGFSAAPANALGMAIPAFPPDACIVEISTIPDGLWVGATRVQAGTTDAKKKKNSFVMAPTMDGGGPLKIYGGTRCLVGGDDAKDRGKLLSGDTLKEPSKGGLWLVRNPEDPKPIHLNKWVEAESKKGPLIQKQVVIHHNNAMSYFFPDFKYTLIKEEMPYGIKDVSNGEPIPENDPARDVWVRVASGTDMVVSTGEPPSDWYTKTESAKTKSEGQSGYKVGNVDNPSDPIITTHFPYPNSRSRHSAPVKVSFPSGAQKDFHMMIRVAACIAFLCRGDLDLDPTSENYLKEKDVNKKGKPCGFYNLAKILNQSLGIRGAGVYGDTTPWIASKSTIAAAAENIAETFMRRASSIPDAVFEAVVESHGKNLLFYMSESRTHSLVDGSIEPFKETSGVTGTKTYYFDNGPKRTLWDHCATFETGRDKFMGAHMNRMCAFDDENPNMVNMLSASSVGGWNEGCAMGKKDSIFPSGKIGGAAVDRIPVFIGWSAQLGEGVELSENEILNGFASRDACVVPARHCFTKAQLDSALAVLNIATLGVTDGHWVAVRPLETIMLPVEEFIEKVLHFLKTVRDGILAVIKQILDYIRMIEARIMEIQQLIRKIQAILKMFSDFTISGDLSFLVCTGAGTQGLIAEFMQSENKPEDGPAAIGSGACVVAGGLPLIILDMLQAIFAAQEDGGGSGEEDPYADPSALIADEGL